MSSFTAVASVVAKLLKKCVPTDAYRSWQWTCGFSVETVGLQVRHGTAALANGLLGANAANHAESARCNDAERC
jgi:hypothetical protein